MALSPPSPPPPSPSLAYQPARAAQSRFVDVRGLRYHLHAWGDASMVTPQRPALVMLHGWMDVGASFQFVVDALAAIEGPERYILALDWRGFGLSEHTNADGYWFPDYIADLDALLDALWPDVGVLGAQGAQSVDLLGHSMGGNVAMMYAGVRPPRIRRLINLEGFGMPATDPQQAPTRYAQWLDELKTPQRLMTYNDAGGVARRLRSNNPRLSVERAEWLAPRWSRLGDDGRWHILADPNHKRVYPILYRKEEVVACWQRITAPLLWIEGELTDMTQWWGKRYPRDDFEARLAVVSTQERAVLADAGHMLHHDQPQALAALLERFLNRV